MTKYGGNLMETQKDLTITEDLVSLVLWITRRMPSEMYRETCYKELDMILKRTTIRSEKLKELHELALNKIQTTKK